jgi:hypothetical protein
VREAPRAAAAQREPDARPRVTGGRRGGRLALGRLSVRPTRANGDEKRSDDGMPKCSNDRVPGQAEDVLVAWLTIQPRAA